MLHKLADAFAAFFNFLASAFDMSDLYDDEELDDELLQQQLERDAAMYTMWMY